jgi:hypothetical protein
VRLAGFITEQAQSLSLPMNTIPDLPPTVNAPAPVYDKRLAKQLEGLGSIDGLPFFRLVWGQDKATTKRFWRGEWHFKYKHHSKSKYMQAEASYDSKGHFVGYSRFFDIDSIIPAGTIRDTVKKVTEYGVPRFYIEMATYHDYAGWEAERFTNERNQPEYDDRDNLIDFTGPYPPFGIEYDALYLIASHEGCCNSRTSSNMGIKDDGSRCYGFRRLPQQQDVDMVARRFAEFKAEVGNKDLKADATDLELKQIAKDSLSAYKSYWDGVEEKIWDDTHQLLIPHSKRMITHSGSNADMKKYHFQGMSLTAGDNQHIVKEK